MNRLSKSIEHFDFQCVTIDVICSLTMFHTYPDLLGEERSNGWIVLFVIHNKTHKQFSQLSLANNCFVQICAFLSIVALQWIILYKQVTPLYNLTHFG